MAETEKTSDSRRPWTWVFAFLMALAVGLRLWNAAASSLKLDDFHSLHHARAADSATFFRVLREDNHPPLSFLLVRITRALLGESEWALRTPALVAGLLTLLVAWRLACRLPCAGGRAAALCLLACSSLHMELSSDVRMYALLALAVTGFLEALVAVLEEGRGQLRAILWCVAGLHAHYHFLYAVSLLGAGALLLALRVPAYRARVAPLLRILGTSALLSLPWYALAFPHQLAHGLSPGGSDATVPRLLEGWVHLVFLNVSSAGPFLRGLWLLAGALLLAQAGLGTWSLWRRAAPERPAFPLLLALSAFGIPVLTWAASTLSPRAGFEWRYLGGALSAFALLAGTEACAAGAWSRARRCALFFVCASAAGLAVQNARDPGEEDYRGAVRWILEHASAGDAVVAADWQPQLFPHAIGWSYYAPRLARGELPALLEYRDDFSLADPAELDGRARVFCCFRSLKDECGILRLLRERYPREDVLLFGRSIYVHVFTRS